MLSENVANNVILAALEMGADFCDLFIDETQIQNIRYASSKVMDVQSGISFGIGVRLIYGDQSLYGYSNSVEEQSLLKMVKSLGTVYKKTPTQNFSGSFSSGPDFRVIKGFADENISLEEKIEKAVGIDKLIRSKSELIQQVSVNLMQKKQNIEIFNSEGLHVHDFRPYIRMATSAVASDGNKQNSSFDGPGARGGWSFVKGLNSDEVADRVAKQVITVLHADPCPAGKMPVVIENAFGGVIFHEACGHSLETTSVQNKASVFWDKKGKKIANTVVNAIDDGTIDNAWGSISIDDEGMETQRTQLIKDGVLENFMCDKLGNIKTGHPRTGSARRQSYKFAPASRMRNTFIEAGKSSREEILSTIKDGLYCKSMGGGSVNPGTGEFNFSVQEGYIIKDGKLDRAVKGATLIGSGGEILENISMIGNNLELSAGMCGSVSGAIEAAVGQPILKVDEIVVGGQA
jgi:TldD protein